MTAVTQTVRFAMVPFWALGRVKPNGTHIYAVLCHWADEKRECWPSIEAIAEFTRNERGECWSEPTVRRALHHLEEEGLIRIVERYNENGAQTSNGYVLAWHAPIPKTGTPPLPELEGELYPLELDPVELNNTYSATPRDRGVLKAHESNEEFDEFWKLYPRSQNKQGSLKAYKRAMKEVSHEFIMGALRQQLHSPGYSLTTTHIPYASTWLNNKRWEDEPELPKNNDPFGKFL